MMKKKRSILGAMSKHNRLLIVFTVCLFVIMSLVKTDIFLTWENINSMLLQVSEIGLLSVGMMLAFLIGGIDLSVVSNAVLSATVGGYVMLALEGSPGLAIGACVVTSVALGTVLGIFNGFVVSKINLPPILVTLGTNSLYRGIAVGLTGGSTLGGFPEGFAVIGNGTVFGIYYAVLIFAAVMAGVVIFLNQTASGRKAALMGSNAKAAYFSGVNNTRLSIKIYGIIGLIGGIAGIVMMSRSNSINPDYGTSYLLQTILICVVSGVNIDGGKVSVAGMILALVLMQIISTSFNMLMVGYSGATFFKNIIWGALLIALMVITYYSSRRKPKAEGRKGIWRKSC